MLNLPMHAKCVGTYFKRQRYKCKECDETFFEDLPNMDINRSVTNRLKAITIRFIVKKFPVILVVMLGCPLI